MVPAVSQSWRIKRGWRETKPPDAKLQASNWKLALGLTLLKIEYGKNGKPLGIHYIIIYTV